ncbi:MAG: DUF6089 family protein [Bacteroidales bacterium]|nr:DUF6089 family protein [Bacteroidales bacterium]
MKRPGLFDMVMFVMAILLLPSGVKGQTYRMEFGLLGGSSFYMGDANNEELFYDAHSSYGLLARYNLNGRFALKANTILAGISGTTQGNASAFMNGADVSFSRRIVDAGVQLEMNFYDYGVPDFQPGSSKISPYILLGFGITGYESEKKDVCANIPLGLGIKMKILPRVNLGCEWTFRKTFADDLDYSASSTGFQLQNSWSGVGSWNKNKDWYSILMIYVSYDLYGIGSKCFK